MSARCTGEPVSWLRLERYHLGELEGPERERVAEHVAACPACAACLETIRAGDAVALPPLALPKAARSGRGRRISFVGAFATGMGALAAAATVILALRTGRPLEGSGRGGPSGPRVKGGSVAFSLVREDGERVDGDSGVYRDGDRFKALVTCPPGGATAFDVVVYDEGGASFPLEPAGEVRCGNDVALAGALRLTGRGVETVCLVWSDAGRVERGELGGGVGPDVEGHACKRMVGAAGP